jgi:neutral ceramidase
MKMPIYTSNLCRRSRGFHGPGVRPGFVAAFAACLMLFAADAAVAQEEEKVFRAGAATSNITPPLGEPIVGGWVPIPATNVHDELHARCLVLDDGETKLAIVLVDSVGVPREVYDQAKSWIEEETGIPRSHVLTAATHTHSATSSRTENRMVVAKELNWYQQFLARRIADGVRRALNHLEPARIGWGGVDEPSEVFNRRWIVSDPELARNPFGGIDQARMNPPSGNSALVRPAGPIDPEVSFVSVQSIEGRPIALLANYSLHYVGGVRSGDISADYFGYFARYIAEGLDAEKQEPPFVGIMSNGTSGDVNNVNFRERRPRKQPYERMQEVADLIARRVLETLPSIEYQDSVTLDARERELALKVRKPTPEMIEHFKEVLKKPEDEQQHRRERIYARRIELLKESPEEVSVVLQTFRIGNLGISAIPFETFAETGLEIKDRGPFGKTFTIELANGSYGYLPTPEQHELGGYETWMGTNNVQKDASVKIVDQLMEMFAEMRGSGEG